MESVHAEQGDRGTSSHLERWHKGWDSGRYSVPGQGFHEANPNPLLTKYLSFLQLIPKDDILKQERVLIPLCGKSVDMIYFANQKISALGLEAIPRAISEFSDERKSSKDNTFRLHKKAEHNWKINDAGIVSIVEGDALVFKIDEKGPIDAIWDRAALVALRPEDRATYVSMLHGSIKEGGRVLLVVVEHDMVMPLGGNSSSNVPNGQEMVPYGPPYSIPTETVKSLYTNAGFNFLEELYREDKIDREPRWKGKGATKFEVVCYILEKRSHELSNRT